MSVESAVGAKGSAPRNRRDNRDRAPALVRQPVHTANLGGHLRVGNAAQGARPRFVSQAVEPAGEEAGAPLADRGRGQAQALGDASGGAAGGAGQDDAGALCELKSGARQMGQRGQGLSFVARQDDRRRGASSAHVRLLLEQDDTTLENVSFRRLQDTSGISLSACTGRPARASAGPTRRALHRRLERDNAKLTEERDRWKRRTEHLEKELEAAQRAGPAGVRQNTLTDLLRHSRNTDTSTLLKLAAALDVDVAELLMTREQRADWMEGAAGGRAGALVGM